MDDDGGLDPAAPLPPPGPPPSPINGDQTAPAQPTKPVIRLATFNIVSARASRLEMALHAMFRMNVDLGILTEAKLTDALYPNFAEGYHVFATQARSRNHFRCFGVSRRCFRLSLQCVTARM